MGAKPHLKGGWGQSEKPLSLGCFCAYIAGCRGISAPFIPPSQNPQFLTVPPPHQACWVVIK